MDDFKGLYRDTTRSKTPPMMWEFAKNILLSKGFTSVTNEDGFDFKTTIPGKCIGIISTNDHIVYFSVDGIKSIIGYTKREDPTTYIPVLKTNYLGFKENRPIEGVYFYNYKKELIVSWCDGIFDDSNTPKIFNLMNPPFDIDPTTFELTNFGDIAKMELFSVSLEADTTVSYLDKGTLDVEVAYITHAYVAGNGQVTPYAPLTVVAYPKTGQRRPGLRDIIVTLLRLDPNYTKVKIAFIGKKDEAMFAYESDIRTYSGSTYSEQITATNKYNDISVESLVIPSISYTRVNTMTSINSQVVIGNLKARPVIDFQPYANALILDLHYDNRNSGEHSEPLLCPDEVYSMYISLQYLNGEYSEEFHIPGIKDATGLETVNFTNIDLQNLGIDDYTSLFPLKKFHVINSGGFVSNTNPSTGLGGYTFPTSPYTSASLMKWGYWQNEEVYPYHDAYGSITIGTDTGTITTDDLRGTHIRYHRVPGLDSMAKRCGITMGKVPYSLTTNIGRPDDFHVVSHYISPAFSVSVNNFDTIVPQNIKDLIQGYKLSIVKKDTSNRLVKDINFLVALKETSNYINDVTTVTKSVGYYPYRGEDYDITYFPRNYALTKVISTELAINRPYVGSAIIKSNFGVGYNFGNTAESGTVYIDTTKDTFTEGNTEPDIILIPDTQRYAVLRSLSYRPGNNIPAYSSLLEEAITLECNNTLEITIAPNPLPPNYSLINWNPLLITKPTNSTQSLTKQEYNGHSYTTSTVTDYADVYKYIICSTFITPIKDIHSGFNPKDFITLGTVKLRGDAFDNNLINKSIRNGGDVFINNLIDLIYGTFIVQYEKTGVTTIFRHDKARYLQMVLYGGISTSNNSEIYYAHDKDILKEYYLTDTDLYNDDQSNYPELSAKDYTVKIYNPTTCSSLNDLFKGIVFSIESQFTTNFPFRVHRSLMVPNENLNILNARTFQANDYYEMPNDKGAITALRASNKQLHIQQKYSLYIASIKDKLTNVDSVTYLGQGDLFDRTPDEIFTADNKGVIGCTSKWASRIVREGYVVVDQNKGNIYLVDSKGSVKVLSSVGMRRWFFNNSSTLPYLWKLDADDTIPVDNPFTQVGHLIGYDFQYNRLLFTKKLFVFNKPLGGAGTAPSPLYTFDGEYYYKTIDGRIYVLDFTNTLDFTEVSHTFSFSLDSSTWVCEHDYYPTAYTESVEDLLSLENATSLYQHNSKVNKGTYYKGITYPSYVDLIFNGRLDLTKLYQSVTWNSEVVRDDGQTEYFKTIDAVALYTDYQATGVVPLDPNDLASVRVVEEQWNFNNFRDIVADRTLPIIDEATGEFIVPNLNPSKSWFDKSNFISTFLIVRMIMNNADNNAVYINTVNVKSRTSDR